MNLTMLGTGNALVTECYNTCFVLNEEKDCFLVDGGGGNAILHQLKYAGLDWKNIHEIFVTHKHIDHLLGIIWLVRMICQHMSQGKYTGAVNIYGHDEVIPIIQDIANQLLQPKQTAFIGQRLHFITVCDGETKEILGKQVTFFDIHSTKAKQFGFCMELDNREKFTCCGDEPYHECERKYAQESKWLLHEAFCLYAQADIFSPYEKHHSTVKDACEFAERLKIQNLLLYHTEDKNIKKRKELYLSEGEKYYHGNLYIPDDLEVLML